MVHAVGPIFGDAVDVGSDRLHLDDHLRDGVLHFRVVGHGSGDGQGFLVLDSLNGKI